jgi:octanoyl-[GcvH]:protein N-octanoyltransferase
MSIQLIRERAPGSAAFDTATSRSVLLRVAKGELPETFRLYRPQPIVAFGRRDEREPGFQRAVTEARARGFEAVIRLAGGRAAVFHEGTLAFAHTIPDEDVTSRTYDRFRRMASLMAGALRRIGVDARVGEVPGEYCPGDYSVNAAGRVKLVGIGQRLVSGAAHVGGVVVAEDGHRVRSVLVPVYRALGLSWDPATASSVQDEIGVTWDEVERAVVSEIADRYVVEETTLDDATLEVATRLEPDHSPESTRDFRVSRS